MVSFVPQPVEIVDLVPLHYYACKSETSPVTQRIIVEMFKDEGSVYIVKDRLIIHSGGMTEERKIETEDDLNAALWEVFGIKV